MPSVNFVRLSDEERALLTETWRYYQIEKQWIPRGLLHHRFSSTGDAAAVRARVKKIGDQLIRDAEGNRYVLTALGLLESNDGARAADLLAKYLTYITQRFPAKPEDRSVSSEEIAKALHLGDADVHMLGQFIWHTNLFAGGSISGETWTVQMPHDIDGLLSVEDFQDYVVTRAANDSRGSDLSETTAPWEHDPTPKTSVSGKATVSDRLRTPFSRRHAYSREAEITIREDAPEGLRSRLLFLSDEVGVSAVALRDIACRVLRVLPRTGDWPPDHVSEEAQKLIKTAEWPKVYDLVEALYERLRREDVGVAGRFQAEINDYLREAGIGWQLIDGEIQTRGGEDFEHTVRSSVELLSEAGRPTASEEIREAIHDLSRRPEPDLTGAVQHALAALECVARAASDEPSLTLGAILRRHPGLFPKPLDAAVEKAWGYASEMGRHLQEGRTPSRTDVEFLVGLAATIATYLSRKLQLATTPPASGLLSAERPVESSKGTMEES